MLPKLLTGIIAVLVGLGVMIWYYQFRSIPTSIDSLTQRVVELEVQNMQLLKQLEWMEDQIELAQQKVSADRAKIADLMSRPSKSFKTERLLTGADSSTEYEDHVKYEDHVEYEDFNDAVAAGIPEERPREDSPVDKAESHTASVGGADSYKGMRESLNHNLGGFAETHQLDNETEKYIARVLDESVNKIVALKDSVNARELDGQQFAEEVQRMQDDMDMKLSAIFTAEQMTVFRNQVLNGANVEKNHSEKRSPASPSASTANGSANAGW